MVIFNWIKRKKQKSVDNELLKYLSDELKKRVDVWPFELEISKIYEERSNKKQEFVYKSGLYSWYTLQVGGGIFDVVLNYFFREKHLQQERDIEKRMKALEPKITIELFGIIMGEKKMEGSLKRISYELKRNVKILRENKKLLDIYFNELQNLNIKELEVLRDAVKLPEKNIWEENDVLDALEDILILDVFSKKWSKKLKEKDYEEE